MESVFLLKTMHNKKLIVSWEALDAQWDQLLNCCDIQQLFFYVVTLKELFQNKYVKQIQLLLRPYFDVSVIHCHCWTLMQRPFLCCSLYRRYSNAFKVVRLWSTASEFTFDGLGLLESVILKHVSIWAVLESLSPLLQKLFRDRSDPQVLSSGIWPLKSVKIQWCIS